MSDSMQATGVVSRCMNRARDLQWTRGHVASHAPRQNLRMDGYRFGTIDPTAADVVALLEAHITFSRKVTPPGHVHAFEPNDLVVDDVTLFGLHDRDDLLGIGALRHLDVGHVEIKSMHTAAAARGRGVGRRVLEGLLDEATSRGYARVSLETGTMEAFAPARTLYESAGFEPCPPFGDYWENPNSVCMTRELP